MRPPLLLCSIFLIAASCSGESLVDSADGDGGLDVSFPFGPRVDFPPINGLDAFGDGVSVVVLADGRVKVVDAGRDDFPPADGGDTPWNGECTNNGQDCDDGNPCTIGDACQNGVCMSGTFACDDGLSCTSDFCQADGSCSNELGLGACLIGGGCFEAGDPNPGAPCEICLPTTDPTGWSSEASSTELSGPSCESAFDLGELDDGGNALSVQGNLADEAESDWYRFTAVDGPDPAGCDTFHARARLMNNSSGAYRMDVRQTTCNASAGDCVGVRDFEWFTDFHDAEAGECACALEGETNDHSHICSDNTATFFLRVSLTPGKVPLCEGYILEVSNGVY